MFGSAVIGMSNKRGSNRQPGAPALPGAGRPPQSITLRVGDGIALRYGFSTPLELGEVVEIKRGIPRSVRIELRNGTTVWVLAETPKAD
jgi:hypothetical protein